MSNLKTLVFRLTKFVFCAKVEVSAGFKFLDHLLFDKFNFNVNIFYKTSKRIRKVFTPYYTKESHI